MVFSSILSIPRSRFNLVHLVITFGFLSLPLVINGQKPAFNFNHLTVDQKLTSNNTTCLLKDTYGYIWIGTDAGLNRFDGNAVTPYIHHFGDSTSLVSNDILSLFEDSLHRIWIGTGGGISIVEPETGRFTNYRKVITSGDTLDFTEGIKSIRQFKNNIWIATTHSLITCPVDTFSFTRIDDHFDSKDEKPIYFLDNQAVASAAGIWFLTSKGPLYTKDGSTFIHRYNNPDHWPIFKYQWFAAMYNDGDSVFYFTAFNFDGVYTYRPAHQSLDSIPFIPSPDASALWTLSLLKFSENELIGSTDNNGVFILNTTTGTSKFYYPESTNPNSLSSKHGNQIFIDDQKTIFVATDQGLDYANASRLPFTIVNTAKTGIEKMNVCIAEDDEGNMWFGTLTNGLFCYTPSTRDIKPYPFPGRYNKIWSIHYDNNQLLIGTKGGLATFSTKTKKFKSLSSEIPKKLQELTDQPSTAILKDKSGAAWIALFPYGLIKYNFQSKEFIHFTSTDPSYHLPGNGTIWSSALDNEGTLWLGCSDDNLVAINTNDNSIRNIKIKLNVQYEKIGKIASILPDNNGNIWIGTTQAGLIIYHLATSSFNYYDTRHYFFSNSISSMVFDQDHSLWINTIKGIFKFNPSTEIFTLYDKSDGLPVNQYNHDASINIAPIFMTRNGNIYSCSDAYLVSFDPRSIGTNPNFPKLKFSSYSISGTPYTVSSTVVQLDFSYKDKNITFEFSGINFIDPSKTQFEYKLEDYDKDWNTGGNIPTATYSSLPTGNHLLRLRTTNKRGQYVLDSQEANVMIHVTGPIWKEGWFIPLCLSLCALIFLSIYKIRLNQFNKIQIIRQKISRDLHDNIGSTLSSISINSMVAEKLDPEIKPELIPVIRSIGQSARTAIDNMNDIVWAISPANESFQAIMDRLQIFAATVLGGRSIQLQMDVDDTLQDVQFDIQQRKNVYLFLREAIHNVAKYSKAQYCQVTGTLNHKILSLQVTDDGIGFDELTTSLGGNGMANMKARAEELNGQFQVHSERLKGTQVSLQFTLN